MLSITFLGLRGFSPDGNRKVSFSSLCILLSSFFWHREVPCSFWIETFWRVKFQVLLIWSGVDVAPLDFEACVPNLLDVSTTALDSCFCTGKCTFNDLSVSRGRGGILYQLARLLMFCQKI
jgi:hypothetical protein